MEVLQKFTAVGLNDIGKANFMNRVDTKFPLRSEVLWKKILPEIIDDYYIVEIGGLHYMEYKTVYFDTPDNMFFTAHHNGKLDRYKVRKRMYVDTKTSFLEVKHKNNKGKTKKKRIEIQTDLFEILPEEYEFLSKHIPYNPETLKPVIENHFHRITLVKKDMGERCTIDCELGFSDSKNGHETNSFAMVELKHEAGAPKSPLQNTLFKYGVHKSGFSKYCMGRVLNGQQGLKTNLFREKLRMLQKRLNNAL
ncbi:MAG: VTC domain-containing protein [Bacteroidales bacterium]|nr:VTC domain-containing protein [Bacteroidales bacterium]MBQ5539273.1 VTC domain-containing protein [Bacteroidales bacterium]